MPTRVKGKVEAAKQALTVHLPDTRGTAISRWGRGNTKIGMDGVYTYSRLPGRPDGRYEALAQERGFAPGSSTGTCPGSSPECESICYAKRVIGSPVWEVWQGNSFTEQLPEEPLPGDAKIVRIHVSGDFTSIDYIEQWIALAQSRPDVRFFSYTRSWRFTNFLPALDRLRALRNVELFASMDKSIAELPPEGWRRAWIENDPRAQHTNLAPSVLDFPHNWRTENGQPAYLCPEETGRKPTCQACQYCIRGQRGDVIFLLH